MAHTQVEKTLAEAERAHADDPERAELLARARRFKSSWVELAASLTECKRHARWKGWGYDSFEDYARRELHLRQETVDKLTGSYLFLHQKAPEVLSRDGAREKIPSFQSVDFLRRAEEQPEAPEEAVAELRRRVIDDGAALPALQRKYREVIFPLGDEEKRGRDAKALRQAARRLGELLDGTEAVERALAGEVRGALERLLAALGDDADERDE